MKRLIIAATLCSLGCTIFFAYAAGATSLQIAPLRYETTLKSGEAKKGYVDISNPSAVATEVRFEVQAFRQVDDEGNLEFYDDDAVSAGVLLDLKSIDLSPNETLRLYFLIDGKKLPSGESYAAILARTVPSGTTGSAQAVRVGTILEITNGEPGTHSASISDFSAPLLQIGESIESMYVVHNDGDTSAFRPTITMGIQPYSSKDVEGPLVFAGRSRTVTYKASGDYFGPVWLQAATGNSLKGQLVFVVTGYWRWVVPLIIFGIVCAFAIIRLLRRKKRKRY